jgi:hypothetical protein
MSPVKNYKKSRAKKSRNLVSRRTALKGVAALGGALLVPRGVHGYAPKRNPHPTWNMVMERHIVFDHTPDSPMKDFWRDIKKYGAPPTGALSDYFRRVGQSLPVGDMQLIGHPGSGKTLMAQCAKLILGKENVLAWNRPTLWYGRCKGKTNFACIDGYYKYGITDRPNGVSPILAVKDVPESLHLYHNSVWLLDKISRPMPFDLLYGRLEDERDAYVESLHDYSAEGKSATKPKYRLVA